MVDTKIRNAQIKSTGASDGDVLTADGSGGAAWEAGGTAGGISADGWESADAMTYASSDDPTYTVAVSGDQSAKYSAGMRVKLTDSGTQYFIITKVAYSDPNTTLTLYGGTDYDLSTGSITNPYYSVVKAPQGFPLDPLKWTVETTDTSLRSQNTPTQNTWYNPGSLTISVPIGCWKVSYRAKIQANDSAASGWGVRSTLSTANNSESDADYTCRIDIATVTILSMSVYAEKWLNLAAKTAYYLNISTPYSTHDSIHIHGADQKTIIRAVCAYL